VVTWWPAVLRWVRSRGGVLCVGRCGHLVACCVKVGGVTWWPAVLR
jgi:hypothetical protein